MAFRKYSGLNYAANNIVRNHYANSKNQQITNILGQINSKVVSASHIDMSANSLLNVECIYFYDGTTLCTAGSQGLDGPTGQQGATGSQGSDGPTGQQGQDGPTGQQGATGSQGLDGPTGQQGQDGPTGQQGAQGAQGATGPIGQQGEQGATGYGSQGSQGLQGSQGQQGPGDSYWTLDSNNLYNNNSGNEVDISGNLNVQDILYVTSSSATTTANISGSYTNTGSTTSPPGTYTFWWYNTLTSSPPNWTFDISTNFQLTFNYLLVGGGGGGSQDSGGGGGGISAGTFSTYGVNNVYDINVGLGGNGGGENASPGTSSTISINGNTFATAYGGDGAYYIPSGSISAGGLGGIGYTQNGAYGGWNYASGGPNNGNAEPVLPINTFYLDSAYNGYYNPNNLPNAFYSGGGGGYDTSGSQTQTNNPGLGGGPGGMDGPQTLGSAGWWGAGGAANGNSNPPYNGGYNGIVIIWIETANLTASNPQAVTITGPLNLTNPINTIYSTLPTFTISNIGYTITTPSPGYVICPAQPNWTTAYSSPPLLGIFVVTCRQWSGGLSIGGGYVCISYFIDTFDENCFSMMTPINWNNYNPYLGNTTQDWVSSSLTRIVSLSNAPIYINYISSWPTNLSYEIVKIA